MQTLTNTSASPVEPTYLVSLLPLHTEASHMGQGVYSWVLVAWVGLTPIGADRQLGEMLWYLIGPPASDSEGLFPIKCVSCVFFFFLGGGAFSLKCDRGPRLALREKGSLSY